MADLNHVTLTGVLARDPITRVADHGTQQPCPACGAARVAPHAPAVGCSLVACGHWPQRPGRENLMAVSSRKPHV
jgi:hypothetical protein